jgi:hypothetical protein
MLVRSSSVMLSRGDTGVECLLLFARNLDDGLGGSFLLSGQFQELMDEV